MVGVRSYVRRRHGRWRWLQRRAGRCHCKRPNRIYVSRMALGFVCAWEAVEILVVVPSSGEAVVLLTWPEVTDIHGCGCRSSPIGERWIHSCRLARAHYASPRRCPDRPDSDVRVERTCCTAHGHPGPFPACSVRNGRTIVVYTVALLIDAQTGQLAMHAWGRPHCRAHVALSDLRRRVAPDRLASVHLLLVR